LGQQLDGLDRYLDEHHISREQGGPPEQPLGSVVSGYIDRMNAALRLATSLTAYVNSFVSTDSYNAEARRWQSRLEQLGVRLQRQTLRFEGWLGEHAAALPEVVADPGSASQHAFYLQETVEQSRYLMSEVEEALAAELSLSGNTAWSKLQATVTSQLVVPFERDGQREQLPVTVVRNLMHTDPDPAVRRRAYEVEVAAWASVREPLAAALNGVKGFRITLDRRRGRTDALHTALDQSRIDRETLEALLGAMRRSFPAFRRYMRAKARRLGHAGGLPWWDIHAPVVPLGAGERHFTWDEAQAFVLKQFATFSDDLAALAERAFAERWIDAEPRAGKRGGAFCLEVPTVSQSRILCNFDGSLDSVFTVAHELGHAYHNYCARDKTMLQSLSPMTANETASTLCETLVTDAALASAASPAEELSILETFLIGANQVVVDITSRFLFEQEVFERRAQAELAADEFCEIMLRCQEETYGDGLDARYQHPYMWTWKPHYYRPGLSFYNFPYAFGLLFGIGLYALFKERGADFVPEYRALLASTGEARPADLAARFGLDLRTPAFWEKSLGVIEARIERYLEL
jgi:pepF/M3 family oligoendopeptidase